jgi:hypothetical protein
VKPVQPGAQFKGRIRYENLTPVELGALLFSLDLPDGCCHKVGLGKPYGLGSIAIQTDLVLVDRPTRYSKLFDGENWYLSEEKDNDSIGNYKKKFERFVLTSIGEDNLASLWDNGRMKELRAMLSFSGCASDAWLEKTKYLQVGSDEYKNRNVLPKPGEVRNSSK